MVKNYNTPLVLFTLANTRKIVSIGEKYVPEIFQIDIHKSKAKYRILVGAPGSGKTIVGVMDLLDHVNNRAGNALIVVPTFTHYKDVISLELSYRFPKKYHIPMSAAPHRISIGNGRYIFIRSAENPERIHGLNNITWAWIDEPEDIPIQRKVLKRIKERFARQRIGTAKFEREKLLLTGVAELKNGVSWVQEEMIKKADEGDIDYYFRRAPLSECKRIGEERKAQLFKENPPGTWAYDRLEAIYRPDPEGLIYPELPNLGMPFLRYNLLESDEIGFSADLTHGRDPFVFGILGRKDNIWTLFHSYRNTGGNEYTISQDITALFKRVGLYNSNKFNVKNGSLTFYHDHDGGIFTGNLASELLDSKIDLSFRNAHKGKKSVKLGIEFLRDSMIKNQIQIDFGAKDVYYELASYKWKEKKPGEPEHPFSHGPDMLRYFIWSDSLNSGLANLYK